MKTFFKCVLLIYNKSMFENIFKRNKKDEPAEILNPKEAMKVLGEHSDELSREIEEKRMEIKSLREMEYFDTRDKMREIRKNLAEKSSEEEKKEHLEDRNFNIDIEYNYDRTAEVVLVNDNGGKFYINDLLPDSPDYKIVATEDDFMFQTKDDGQYVMYPPEAINRRSFLLDVLHEIGHAHQEADDGWKRKKLHQQQDFRYDARLDLEMYKKEQDKYGENIVFADDETNILLDKLEIIQEEVERNAWAYALTEIRKIEELGYDVLSGFGDENGKGKNKEIWSHIKYCLSTYENSHTDKFRDAGVITKRDPKWYAEKKKFSNSLRNPK